MKKHTMRQSKNTLCRVDVDIDLSSNPKVRTMFTDGGGVMSFLRNNQIKIVGSSANLRTQETTHVELAGAAESLIKFVDEFLSEDLPGGVYTLYYRR
jgi:hypothetical protein